MSRTYAHQSTKNSVGASVRAAPVVWDNLSLVKQFMREFFQRHVDSGNNWVTDSSLRRVHARWVFPGWRKAGRPNVAETARSSRQPWMEASNPENFDANRGSRVLHRLLARRRGETGNRAGFGSRFLQGIAGSSPAAVTKRQNNRILLTDGCNTHPDRLATTI